ncbi:MAG TPA: DUF3108 domain-containing protein, partial [Chthoniobacterales bacterium]
NFAEPRPVRVQYGFGWNGLTAATAELHFSKTADARFQLEGTGRTIGMASSLWQFEVNHVSTSDAHTLRPLHVKETEAARSKRWTTELEFTPAGVTSRREQQKDSTVKSKTRHFEFPNVQSLNSALFFLRTQPLPEGAVHRIVVYPGTNAYLCTITAGGRDRITVPTGSYDAIKLDVQLNKIGKDRELLPHKKFKRATVWLSNDSDRLIVRIEAQIFLGTVFAELQSVQFDDGKP